MSAVMAQKGAVGRVRPCPFQKQSGPPALTHLLGHLCARNEAELSPLCIALVQETVKVVMRCRPLFGREIEVRDDHAYQLWSSRSN